MIKTKLILPSLISIALVGCSGNTPDCSDSKTENIVIKIVRPALEKANAIGGRYLNSVAKSNGMEYKGNLEDVSLSLDNVRIIDRNEKIDKFSCSASLVSTMGSNKEEVTILYTSEFANNGEKHYVEVSGLSTEAQGALLAVMMIPIDKNKIATEAPKESSSNATAHTKNTQEITIIGAVDAGTLSSDITDENGNSYSFATESDAGNKILHECGAGNTCKVTGAIDSSGIIRTVSAATKQ